MITFPPAIPRIGQVIQVSGLKPFSQTVETMVRIREYSEQEGVVIIYVDYYSDKVHDTSDYQMLYLTYIIHAKTWHIRNGENSYYEVKVEIVG